MDSIFNRFSTVLQNAVDALAPPVPRLEDFMYHWKMLMKFYMNQKTIAKISIESTNIPGHLDQLLKLLLEEESESEAGSTGPCLEYFLQHHLLDLLATLACTDCPPGMKQHVFHFVRRLVTQTKQPILPHVGIYVSVQRLISFCNGTNASPTEQVEIQFLCTICALICKDPHLMNIFNNALTDPPDVDPADQSTATEAGSSPAEASRQRVSEEVANASGDIPSELTSLLARDWSDSVDASNKFPLLDALLSFLLSADKRVMVKACEGIMVVASLPSDRLARLVADRSNLCMVLASRLQATFVAIPAGVDPNDLDDMQVKWGLDSPVWSEGSQFRGCRPVASFLALLDYCDQLVREAHPILGSALAQNIHGLFLDGVLGVTLVSSQPPELVFVTAFISKCLKQVSAPALLNAFVFWLVGESRDPELPGVTTCQIRQQLIDNCFHDEDEVSLETLRLFEVLLEKPDEHILHCLVLSYVSRRSYYDSGAANHVIASWSDEEDEREKNRASPELDFSPGSSPVSRTLAPSNIHKIINSFLVLVPQQLHATADTEQSGYQQYVQDADRQYRASIARCSHNSWPAEATFPEAAQCDEGGSSDSRPEADHERPFYEGPFLQMLFARLLQLPFQPYEINLQLTGLVSRLAMLPHPYLHEFILNPLLPVVDGTVTLFMTLQTVASELATQIPAVEGYRDILQATRDKLLGDAPGTQDDSNCLFESLIILEEFCKELAAIAFVKYHHSS